MENVNNNFFDGHYKDIWRSLIPSELTVKEIDFMLQYFKLKPGDKVLDLMCGYGRHALSLGRKGIEVTAIDNLRDYIDEINTTAKNENLPVKAKQVDILQYKEDNFFDLAICMGNSLNFFNRADLEQLLSSISSALIKGGHILINTWSLTEIAVKSHISNSWSAVGDLKWLSQSKYLFHPTRVEAETIIISPDGKTEIKKGIDYIFSVSEFEEILNKTGFVLDEIYSIPGRKKFALGEPRAYIVATKK
jgi:2-polyprenyl-3-methyl-5-hydroxy-6-metoxy-1,4-benzoquinol methylase